MEGMKCVIVGIVELGDWGLGGRVVNGREVWGG